MGEQLEYFDWFFAEEVLRIVCHADKEFYVFRALIFYIILGLIKWPKHQIYNLIYESLDKNNNIFSMTRIIEFFSQLTPQRS